jgi:hypothetical protein
MSPTKVRPTGRPGAHGPAPSIADCTPLLSLAAGAAGAPVRRASGAAGGGDPRAAGGPCTPEARVVPRRPNRCSAHGPRATHLELHPRPFTTRRGTPASSGPDSHTHGPAWEAGQEESEK